MTEQNRLAEKIKSRHIHKDIQELKDNGLSFMEAVEESDYGKTTVWRHYNNECNCYANV